MPKRRYEMLLPLRYNDGTAVSDDKFDQTTQELVQQFDGISVQPQVVYGTWVQNGHWFKDESVRLVVDVDDTPENRQFFIDFKATLLARFEQLEIYIASYPVDIL